jgi:L-2-hydroxyglutarate oxidase LhgO
MAAPAYDVAIVGAGLVGLATANQILTRRPGTTVAVLDKETGVGRHQSGHNSGVLHSGVYYTPGSLKARLCREGKGAVEAFARDHGIAVDRCGKVIVAVEPSELDRLNALYERGRGNGVPDLSMIGPDELRDLEPHVAGVAALRVGDTAIVDFAAVCRAFADEVVRLGGELFLGSTVGDMADTGRRVTLITDRGEVSARAAVTCAGLYSDRFGGRDKGPRIVPFRGDYYTLTVEARALVRSLIYPVPDPTLPFLGVHFTRRIDGEVWAGPNAVLAFAREGYRRSTVRPGELAETLSFIGFRRLARQHWRTGAAEMWRDVNKSAFVNQLRRYIPELEGRDLVWGPSGVRAQAVAADGGMVDDFAIIRTPRALHLRNAPSPGATASLAIGDHLASEVEGLLAE